MTAKSDGYVECSECGHALEQHTTKGCDVCADICDDTSPCLERWTVKEIMRVRRERGLVGEWRR